MCGSRSNLQQNTQTEDQPYFGRALSCLPRWGISLLSTITRTGEVVSDRIRDGVFTEQEPHNSHRNPMKLFNAIATTAVSSSSLIAIATAATAHPSVTTICNELHVELQREIEEGQLKQQEAEQLLLRCRGLQ